MSTRFTTGMTGWLATTGSVVLGLMLGVGEAVGLGAGFDEGEPVDDRGSRLAELLDSFDCIVIGCQVDHDVR